MLLTFAPLLGDVVTIRKPLARYRAHDASQSGMSSVNAVPKLRRRLHQDVEKACLFASVARRLDLSVPRDPLNYSLHHLQYRFASYMVEPCAHPFPEDTKSRLVYRLVSLATSSCADAAARQSDIARLDNRMCCERARRYRRHLILWRFSVTSRPAVVRTLLGRLSSKSLGAPFRPSLKMCNQTTVGISMGFLGRLDRERSCSSFSNASRPPVSDRCAVRSDRSLAVRPISNDAYRRSPTMPFSINSGSRSDYSRAA